MICRSYKDDRSWTDKAEGYNRDTAQHKSSWAPRPVEERRTAQARWGDMMDASARRLRYSDSTAQTADGWGHLHHNSPRWDHKSERT